jgi:hypothetical protein
MTGIPASTIALTHGSEGQPRSTLTAWANPSFTNRPALRIASAGSASYDIKGISAITMDLLAARVTALVIMSISSIVTGMVVS